jgi:NADPH:quinone reductase-like Zn-dependent oxidoreductase
MQVYESQSAEGPTGWKLVERDVPTPGPGQALIRVKATSLNYRDLALAQNARLKRPYVPLSDGAGEIVAVGEGVTQVAVGDRVAANFFLNWRDGDVRAEVHDSAMGGAVDGMLAEFVALPAESLLRLPDYLTFEQAATLPCAAVTVWNALFEQSKLAPGETVLLLGTGGVSIFGLQFAKMAGARVILTSSSDAKLERARALGADETINYKTTPDWDKAVWQLTGKRGVDHVVEVGGGGTMERSLRSARIGGTVSAIGVLTGFDSKIDPFLIVGRSLRVNGIYVGSVAMFERMLAAMTQNRIEPIIDRVFPFAEAPQALEHLQSGAHFGKIVLRLE